MGLDNCLGECAAAARGISVFAKVLAAPSSPQWRAVVDVAIFIQLGKCYRCHLPGKLYGHHLHYATLGQERAGIDVVAVHWKCHEILDAERKASRTSKTDRTQ